MRESEGVPMRMRWARLRFQIIGPLFAAPPGPGELAERIEELAQKAYKHPTTGELLRYGASTIERWYYQAKGAPIDTMGALARKVRKDAGEHPGVNALLRQAILEQHGLHRRWTYQLHYDNLVALAESDGSLRPLPSYTTLCRYMKSHGLLRERGKRVRDKEAKATESFEMRETRSFEVEHVNGLWHLDFHEGSRSVLLPSGAWKKPELLCVIDDRSRLVCHMQWYLAETAETLVHGLCQAIQKRGLPRALLMDNGGAMRAVETQEGLSVLGIVYQNTRPYGPEQNAKQEVLWAQVEGRLLAMLEGERELSLSLLNEATQAWVEQEYNRSVHAETRQTPLQRFLDGPDVSRPSPSSEALRGAFRRPATRTQRPSDGTISVEGIRFEVPARYRPLKRVHVRYAEWDLSTVDLCDERTGAVLCALFPLDKTKNSDAKRRALPREARPTEPTPEPRGIAPLLRKLMADYAATGLPPAYLAHDDERALSGDNT